MNVLFLRYAVEIAKCRSINKAADKLCVSQPNLSRSIKELEKELNIVIFERTTKGMSLTPEGEKLVMYGKKVLNELDEIEGMFSGSNDEKKVFSISVPRASYIGYAASKFSLVLKKEENFEVYYKETNALRAIKNIMEENYHLGIIRYAEKYEKFYKAMLEEKGLCGEVIAEFSYRLVMNKNNPMAALDDIKYSDLENYTEIAHADPYVPSISLSYLRKEELPDNIKRRIFVFERASQLEIMSANNDCFMWVSPAPQETLERYGLVMKTCTENNKLYKDVLIRKKDYTLNEIDLAFIAELVKSKEKYFIK